MFLNLNNEITNYIARCKYYFSLAFKIFIQISMNVSLILVIQMLNVQTHVALSSANVTQDLQEMDLPASVS